jgi:hypothetical protein
MNLHSFCMENCAVPDAKLLIRLERLPVVQFLRAFLENGPNASAGGELANDAGHAAD